MSSNLLSKDFPFPQLCTSGTHTLPQHSIFQFAVPLSWREAQAQYGGFGMTRTAPQLPNTKGFSEAQVYDTYAKIVDGHGSREAKAALAAGDQVIVGLRIETNTRANRGQGVYDDRIALIWKETPKVPVVPGHVRLLPTKMPAPEIAPIKHGADYVANTEPSAQYEDPGMVWKEVISKKTGKIVKVQVADKIYGPDGNEVIPRINKQKVHVIEGDDPRHEGRKALAELVPGTYTFSWSTSPHFTVPILRGETGQVVRRDVTHDGAFSEADVWQTDQGETVVQTGNFAILIHPASASNTGSAGCQTLSVVDYGRLIATLKRAQRTFYYVLITMQ